MGRTRNLAKGKSKIRKSTIITSVLLILSSLTLIYFTINTYFNTEKALTKNKELYVILNKLKDEHIEVKKEQKNMTDEIDKFKDMDKLIAKTKEEVFKLAKEVEIKINNNETDYKIAYLTFDDGPYYSTNTVLNILKDKQVKATFFTIGLDKDICYDNPNNSCANTYKKIVDNGHTIANHTYSHAIFRGLYSSPEEFMRQVKLQQDLIQNRTGVKTNILRFPGGSATARSLGDATTIMQNLKNNGYGWVDWTAQDGDGGYLPSYDVAWNNLTGSINENIEVILFHDYSTITISLLPNAIKYLEDKNYILLPLFYDSVKVNK